jgi:hypothetical protein
LIARQNFVERRVDRRVVLRSGAAGVVVEYVESAEFICGRADRGLQTIGISNIGMDRDRSVAGQMRGFLTCRRVDICDCDSSALAGEEDRGGAADPGAAVGDERDFSCEPWHRSSLPRLGLTR